MRSRKRRSISKHSGALISSRLMPPKVGSSAATISQNLSTSVSSTSISNESTSAKCLNKMALPSMTGFDAKGPILPRPNTAVPFDITPTKLPFEVYLAASFGFSTIDSQGAATPGE